MTKIEKLEFITTYLAGMVMGVALCQALRFFA